MKRLGSILIALALVISSLEGVNISFADESDKEISLEQKDRKDSLSNVKAISSDESSDDLIYENFKYTVNESEVTITGYIGNEENIVIPSEINQKKVTKIGNSAFSECSNLISVKIPEGVTEIGWYVFEGCSNLTSVDIPEGVTVISEYAFYRCEKLTAINVSENNSEYKSIDGSIFSKDGKTLLICPGGKSSCIIPEGVTSIGESAFAGCSNLTSVDIPEGVSSIGETAFSGCSNLTSVDIPEGVKSIGFGAFAGCSNLTSIDIPEKVISIGDSAFSQCEKLTAINVSENNLGYKSIDGSLFSKNGKILLVVPQGKSSCIIPKGVTSIGKAAFEGCSNLTSVDIPEGVTSIGESAFARCSNLTSVDIPEGVTVIRWTTFLYCTNLTSVKIPEGVTNIETYAFAGCSNLTSIKIPEGVTYIGEYAFAVCSNLTSIEIPQTVTEIGYASFLGCDNLTIYGVANSKAEEFAEKYGITFKTFSKDISSLSITLSSDNYSYTGSQIKPSITVKDGEKTLKNKTDYTVSYGKNMNAGTGTVTITGINDYEGSKTINFTINKRSISSSKVTASSIKNQAYTGKSIKPSITLKQGSKTLKNSTDYTLSYSNNINVGKATITITGKGNYSGSRKVTFTIIPKTVTSVKQTSTSTPQIKLSWSKDSKVTGYQVYRSTSKNGTYKKVATLSGYSKNYYTDSKLSSGKVYYYKVRAYKKVDSTTYYYGNYSSICTASTKCSKPSITVTSPKTKTAKISWKKISGASGYNVYRATSNNGKYTLVKNIKSGSTTSYTNTSLTKGKTYYYKVKAYKVVNGSDIYSDYSSVKSVKVK